MLCALVGVKGEGDGNACDELRRWRWLEVPGVSADFYEMEEGQIESWLLVAMDDTQRFGIIGAHHSP